MARDPIKTNPLSCAVPTNANTARLKSNIPSANNVFMNTAAFVTAGSSNTVVAKLILGVGGPDSGDRQSKSEHVPRRRHTKHQRARQDS